MWILLVLIISAQTGQIISSPPCLEGCVQCTPANKCTDCDQGYSPRDKCQACPQGCAECVSGDKCSTCSDDYELKNNSCLARCNNDKYWDKYKHGCQICPQGCATCSSSEICTSCYNGYYMDDNDWCHQCQQNGGEDSKASYCSECKTKGCSKCQDNGVCSECQEGYFLESDKNLCSDCVQNCVQCASKKSSCSKCNERFTLVNGNCIPCTNCNDSTACALQNVCDQCLDGFWGEYCRNKCNGTCIRCDLNGQCTSCKDNTFGRHCELKCSRNCLLLPGTNSACFQYHGTCTDGCIQGFTGPSCNKEVRPQSSLNVAVIVGSTSAMIVVMVFVLIAGIILWRRRVRRPRGGGGPSGTRIHRTDNAILNSAYVDIDIDHEAGAGHQTIPLCRDGASADNVYSVVQKSRREPRQSDKTRGQDVGTDNVYDIASQGRSQGGATNTDKSWTQAEGDTYSHINHSHQLAQHHHDNEGTYDHVMRQTIQKGGVDDTYDVTSGQTTHVYDHNINASNDEYSTVGNVV